MTSRERILKTIAGESVGHTPLMAWCFGFAPAPTLRWEKAGREVTHWYSLRLEHIHTLPAAWDLEDEFRRVLAWQSLGADDLLEVSVPWSTSPEVTWTDSQIPAGTGERGPVLVREYRTPAGLLRHAVRRTQEETGPGWVVQPDHVPLFEDLNLPRAVEHAVSSLADIPAVPYLYAPPDVAARERFAARVSALRPFAERHGVAVQAWSAFGMDAVVWLAGPERAVLMAMEQPQAFGALVDSVAATDFARTELALAEPGVDIVVERGWYSSTDFWSPRLFDRYVLPQVRELTTLTHRRGVRFADVMTTGVELLGPRLAEAGVDLLYFVGPVQDGLPPERARQLFGDCMAVAGGCSAITLTSRDRRAIRQEVEHALAAFAGAGGFILQPVDALFPDTPWAAVEALIEAWREAQ